MGTAQTGIRARPSPLAKDASRLIPGRIHRVLQKEIRKRQLADQALRLAETKYQSIFEHALEGIFQTSAEGKYIAANPALTKMYGYDSLEQLLEGVDNIATKLYVDPNRRAEFVRRMQERGQVLHFESEVRRRDGKILWVSENVRSIYDRAGNFLYYEGTVDDITELKLAREKLQDELSEAAGYVRSLLPSPLTGSIEADWCYLPCSHLGGDAFGYHWLDDEHFALYLLDVSGHGVGSALLCISALNVLRLHLLASANFHNPSAVLEGLNRAFPMDQNNGKYFTVWYGVYHQPSRQLSYASGGHHPAVLISGQGGEITRLRTNGAAVGVIPGMKYRTARVRIPASGVIYLFSDGVYEIARPDESWQSWEEFAQFLRDERPSIERIVGRMRELHGGGEFEDDFSLLKIKVA